MVHLMLGNIEPGTSDDEIQEFLVKYGFPRYDEIEHVPGEGSRPAVVLTFNSLDPETLGKLQPRIHDLFWKNRRVTARIARERYR
ncbi:RNA-binding protein [Paraburkholderia sp. GAS334]|jgi:hypothetical protein|uniref:RNA-binding protein n=1 Tax=unclassified Paraburkholderia TaxID=2615204 RepID=UPI003D231C61